jgi:hypothetical protein
MSKEDSSQDMSRRKFLGATGKAAATGAAITGISGCMGEDSFDSNGTSAQGAETPSNAGTDTPGNNNQRNAPTGQGQDSNGEEIDIPSWKNVDGAYKWQEEVYKDIEEGSATEFFAFAVDPEYVDESELEPSTYNGEPTSEHAFIHALTDDGEYERKFLDEIFVVAQNLKNESGPGDAFLDLFNDKGNQYGSVSASDPDKQGQIDAFEHIDGEGVLHSSEDLPEYVEQVLTGQ